MRLHGSPVPNGNPGIQWGVDSEVCSVDSELEVTHRRSPRFMRAKCIWKLAI